MCRWVFTSTVATRVQLLQSCLTLCDPMDYSPPGSTVLGILQARILEWVATSSSRGSSWPRDHPASSVSPALQADSYHWATREVLSSAVAIVLENFSLKKTQVIQTRVFFFFSPIKIQWILEKAMVSPGGFWASHHIQAFIKYSSKTTWWQTDRGEQKWTEAVSSERKSDMDERGEGLGAATSWARDSSLGLVLSWLSDQIQRTDGN